MKKIIIVYFVLFNSICFSQNISFSKVIAPIDNIQSASFLATGIVKHDNKNMLSLIGFDTASVTHVNNLQSLYFAEVDSNGENFHILDKYVQSDTNYYINWGAFIKIRNGGFCYIGDIDSIYNDKGLHFIMFFDSNMNNILTKIIPHDTIWECINQIKETHDHCFVIVGGRFASYSQEDVLLMKTDSLGNQIWKNTIVTGYISEARQIEETPDHGFLICGFRSSYTAGQAGKGDPFIIKTDSAGNLTWIKILGNSAQLDGTAAFAITQDSNYIVALGYGTYSYSWPNNTDFLGRLNVIKYTPDGDEIWNKMYDPIKTDYTVSKIQILLNNDFIVIGSYDQYTQGDTAYDFTTSFMFKCNSNGDSLWRKIYYHTDNFGDQDILVDNVLNSDGSITACGYVEGLSLSPSQQIWIMKIDSTGYSPALDTIFSTTGIKEPNMLISKGEINVYPNPATNQITIAYPQQKEEGDIHIYNMLGQIVYDDKLAKGSSQTKLSIQHLKAGLYKVIIREKGMIIGEVSLVKE